MFAMVAPTAGAAPFSPSDTVPNARVADHPLRADEHAINPIPGLAVSAAGNLPVSATPQSQYAVRIKVMSSQQPIQDMRLTLSVTEAPLEDSNALAEFIANPDAAPTRRVSSTPLGVSDSICRHSLAA